MKTIIFQMSVSLDGYFEGPGRELDWHIVDSEFNDYAVETLRASELLIMGRKTYELMASYWPSAPDDGTAVKALMNELPKLVFSRTLTEAKWQNSRLADGSIAEEIARLKQTAGDGQFWVGGSELASAFLDMGLIDEVRLIQTPVILGAGNSVFRDITKRHPLKLLSTRAFRSGNVVLRYEAGRVE